MPTHCTPDLYNCQKRSKRSAQSLNNSQLPHRVSVAERISWTMWLKFADPLSHPATHPTNHLQPPWKRKPWNTYLGSAASSNKANPTYRLKKLVVSKYISVHTSIVQSSRLESKDKEFSRCSRKIMSQRTNLCSTDGHLTESVEYERVCIRELRWFGFFWHWRCHCPCVDISLNDFRRGHRARNPPAISEDRFFSP